jgi:protein-disulfide isomerase
MVSSARMDSQDSVNKYILPLSILIACLLVVGAVVWNNSHPTGTASSVSITDVQLEGEPYIGKADAPVTIAFWSDFQCPYCKAAEIGHPDIPSIQPALPDIIKNYVDAGTVRIVFKDVVFLSPRMGPDSMTAAVYNQSVWKLYPEKYFAWRTAMFEAQDEEGTGFGNAESIDALNATLGLDAAKIKADVAANRSYYEAHAQEVTAQAKALGVDATPSFILGNQLIKGASPFSTFKQAIDALL